jgi:hypothetical protein
MGTMPQSEFRTPARGGELRRNTLNFTTLTIPPATVAFA